MTTDFWVGADTLGLARVCNVVEGVQATKRRGKEIALSTMIVCATGHQEREPEAACPSVNGVEPTTSSATLLLSAREAAAQCGVSPRTWRTWDIAGKIPCAICVGRSKFWRPEELRAWVAAGCPDRVTWEALK